MMVMSMRLLAIHPLQHCHKELNDFWRRVLFSVVTEVCRELCIRHCRDVRACRDAVAIWKCRTNELLYRHLELSLVALANVTHGDPKGAVDLTSKQTMAHARHRVRTMWT